LQGKDNTPLHSYSNPVFHTLLIEVSGVANQISMGYSKIRNVIQNMRCKKHNQKPESIRMVSGSGKVNFTMTTCCEEFQKQIGKQIEIEISKQMEVDLKKTFKKYGFR
jgi:hypothetical protein